MVDESTQAVGTMECVNDVRPSNPVDNLQQAIGELRDSAEAVRNTVSRAHSSLYGEFSAPPRLNATEPDVADDGRIQSLARQVYSVRDIIQEALAISESLEGKG